MRRSAWLTPAAPSVAIEIASRRLAVVELSSTAGRPAITSQAIEPLPEGAVVPALAGINIAQPDAVADALERALSRAGLRSTRRVALVVPDSIARVSLLPLEQIPERPADLDQLVRWQLRKATPFPLEEAQVTHFTAHRDGRGGTIAAVVARRDVVTQYEAIPSALGIHAGLVDLASFNVMNAIVSAGAAASGDWLLVHLSAEATTLAILRNEQLMFYRHRTAVDEEPLGALVHQTAMYHEDRLGGAAFSRVWLSGSGTAAALVRQEVTGRLAVPAETVDLRPIVDLRDRIAVTPDVMDALVAPVGVLIRERKAA